MAQANVVTGSFWENQAAAPSDATIANIPVAAPSPTFTISSTTGLVLAAQTGGGTIAGLNAGDDTIGGFFNSSSVNVPGSSAVVNPPATLTDSVNRTFFEFTGTVSVTTGGTFTVTRDDGLTLVIGGLHVIEAPGATVPVPSTGTYTGPSGNLPFSLVYGECCGDTPVPWALDRIEVSTVARNEVELDPAFWSCLVFLNHNQASLVIPADISLLQSLLRSPTTARTDPPAGRDCNEGRLGR
jgi:hypothetical protein